MPRRQSETFNIPLDGGGFTDNPNIDLIQPNMMLDGSRNINLEERGRRKRGGTSHVNAAAFSGTPRVMGIFDFTLQDTTQHIVTATGDGKLFRDDTNTIKTGLSTNKITDFEVFDDVLYIANGTDTPQKWTGTGNTSDHPAVPSDWATAKPKQFLRHGRGKYQRLWALGFVDGACYASQQGDADDFSDANVIKLTVRTNDGFGIVGGVVFRKELVVMGKQESFIMEVFDADTANWGWVKAPWEGGAANFRLIVRTPTDIICMQEDGEIYSVREAQFSGDLKLASIVRPSQMDRWIKANINLAQIENFHAKYDPVLRAVIFSVTRSGGNTNDTALIYYIDRPVEQAWTIHDNEDSASGFDASASALVRVGVGDFQVYTGDYAGNLWKLNQSNRNDNMNPINGVIKFPRIVITNAFERKLFQQARVVASTSGVTQLTVKVFVDDTLRKTKVIDLSSSGATLGSFVLDTDILGGIELADKTTTIAQIGKRIQFELSNNRLNEDFYISQLGIDFRPFGIPLEGVR